MIRRHGPRRRHGSRRPDMGSLDPLVVLQLLSQFFLGSPLDELQQAWDGHREALQTKWAADHPPGTRCFAEWFFEIVPEHGPRPATEAEHVFLHRVGYIDAAEFAAATEAVVALAREESERLRKWRALMERPACPIA